jgi:hypothetical protein
VLVKLDELFACVPGIGDKETRKASILDTRVFSVFWVGLYGVLEKFARGVDENLGVEGGGIPHGRG